MMRGKNDKGELIVKAGSRRRVQKVVTGIFVVNYSI
jgi:hypothetical protein